jgi:uncharacterized protein YdeI (YjbR/CyaY-like superfamily)
MNARFFRSTAALRAWFEKHCARASELWIGFYKKESGRVGVSYEEAVDEALCVGWIDGIRKRIDDVCYTNRFTPRKPSSNWSAVNIRRIGELTALGRMKPSGLSVFESRVQETRPGRYSYENRPRTLEPAHERAFRARKAAWTFFEAQPPSYRRTAIWWIVSAVKDETRARRLAILIAESARGRRLAEASGSTKKSS